MYSRFEDLLKIHNTTTYKVAKATGITNSTFTEWKKGTYVPKADKLQKIANHFDVSIDYLMGVEKRNQDAKEKIDPAYFRVMKNAKDKGYSAEDIEMAIDFLAMARKRDKE